MFARYFCNWTQTPSGLIADIVSLLTGTTDKNLLSAGCHKGLTTITSTTPAGWSLHCAAVNGDGRDQVVKAQNLDGSWKFFRIRYTGGGNWFFATYATFNPVTFVGTEELSSTGSSYFGITSYLNIYATPRIAVLGVSWLDYTYSDTQSMCVELIPLSDTLAPIDPMLPRSAFARPGLFDAMGSYASYRTISGATTWNDDLRISRKYSVRNYPLLGPPEFEYKVGNIGISPRSIGVQGLTSAVPGDTAYVEDALFCVNGAPVVLPDIKLVYPYPAAATTYNIEGVAHVPVVGRNNVSASGFMVPVR